MPEVVVGKKVASFKLPSTDGDISLSGLKGKNVVLYFYPKDDTPGCTLEGQDFRDHIRKFRARNTVVLGVSRDSIDSHGKFRKKYKLPFDLLSDEDESLCRQFDVIKQKNMYGKRVRGIERSTFLIDEKGVLRREWRKVKVEGHVEEVLKAITEL